MMPKFANRRWVWENDPVVRHALLNAAASCLLRSGCVVHTVCLSVPVDLKAVRSASESRVLHADPVWIPQVVPCFFIAWNYGNTTLAAYCWLFQLCFFSISHDPQVTSFFGIAQTPDLPLRPGHEAAAALRWGWTFGAGASLGAGHGSETAVLRWWCFLAGKLSL